MNSLFALLLLPGLVQADNYSVRKISVESIETIRLIDAASKTEVSIVPSIGNNSYEMTVNGKNVFWTAFSRLAEFKAKPALCGVPLLWPWANRIDQDAYYANGKKFSLNPALQNFRRDSNGQPIHGLLTAWPAWEVTAAKADETAAQVTSRLEFWRYPELMAQFPFAHTIEMTHRLRDGVLEVETVIENHSTEPMPVAIGYHPYFQLHDAPRDEWKVHVAARDHVLLSSNLIPTGEFEPVSFPDAVSLRNKHLDDVFTNLVRDTNGRSEFSVQGKNEKVSVIYGPNYKVATIYAPRGRHFICFEPMAAITNAFNLAHAGVYKQLQSVPPGRTWRESFWVRPSGF